MILLEGLFVGLLAGFLTGGNPRRLRESGIKFESIFLICLSVQLVAPRLFTSAVNRELVLWIAWVIPNVISILIVAANWRQPGMLLVAVGLFLNLTVVVLNSGMPVAVHSAEFMGYAISPSEQAIAASWLHVPADYGTRLLLLGDIIPIPGPAWQRGLVSLGDVLMSVGVGYFAFVAQHKVGPFSDIRDKR